MEFYNNNIPSVISYFSTNLRYFISFHNNDISKAISMFISRWSKYLSYNLISMQIIDDNISTVIPTFSKFYFLNSITNL